MWSELFPDAPAWMPWLALGMNSLLILVILACFAGNPLEAWRSRSEDRLDQEVSDLKRFQKIKPDLENAPAKESNVLDALKSEPK